MALLLVLFATSTMWTWLEVSALPRSNQSEKLVFAAVLLLCMVGGSVLVWITVRRERWSSVTAPAYALVQGIVVGFISGGTDHRYPGIAIRAVGLTILICFCFLTAYRLNLIRVTQSFNRKLSIAVGAVVVYYFSSFLIALKWGRTLSQVSGGVVGLVVSVIIVIIAGMSLISNFDFVAQRAGEEFPRFMEWYAAMGLLVSLIWLYLETLDLMAKAQRVEP